MGHASISYEISTVHKISLQKRNLNSKLFSELNKFLSMLYSCSAQWEKLQQQEMEAAGSVTSATAAAPPATSSLRTKVELPFYSKYLLIAAYLASYNPAKSDKRFFCKVMSPLIDWQVLCLID